MDILTINTNIDEVKEKNTTVELIKLFANSVNPYNELEIRPDFIDMVDKHPASSYNFFKEFIGNGTNLTKEHYIKAFQLLVMSKSIQLFCSIFGSDIVKACVEADIRTGGDCIEAMRQMYNPLVKNIPIDFMSNSIYHTSEFKNLLTDVRKGSKPKKLYWQYDCLETVNRSIKRLVNSPNGQVEKNKLLEKVVNEFQQYFIGKNTKVCTNIINLVK